MTVDFLDLPIELRMEIYKHTFGSSGHVVYAAHRSDVDSLIPSSAGQQYACPRSAQLLRVCKDILYEARPMLYATTRVHVLSHVFAGKLPSTYSNGHPIAAHVQHLIWQVDCDIMKHLYSDDLEMQPIDLAQLASLEIRARAQTWQESFLGEHCDKEKFVKGREHCIEYARYVQSRLQGDFDLIEDRAARSRGCVVLQLRRQGNSNICHQDEYVL